MSKHETIEIYNRRIEAAIEYIDRNLDEELELERIARAAHFSPFHFHRIFRAFRGEPLGVFITRRRVEAAARLLSEGGLPVETIAYRVGFGVPSSLTKAFQRFYGITPSEYRSTKIIDIMKTSQTDRLVGLGAPRIVERKPKTALCVPFRGDYKQLDYPGAFAKMWALVKKQGLDGAEIEHIGIFRNDPKVTDAADLRTDVCLVVDRPAVPENGVEVITVAGGKYAVFTHTGPYNEVQAVYDAIYGEWVPANCDCEDCNCGGNCTCALRDEPVFEKYVNDPEQVAPENLETEIYIPIK
jgi:AraC family transcriptional regulator